MTSPTVLPSANPTLTRAVCRAIVANQDGISMSMMYNVFEGADIIMIEASGSKTDIAYDALMREQRAAGSSEPLSRFVSEALSPFNFVRDHEKRRRILSDVDTILRTVGFSVTDEGHIVPATTGATGAAALTEHLQHKLIERGVHPTVLEYCNEELVNQSLFHAVTEAAKSLMERLRPEWIALDGEKLVQAEFGTRNSPGPRFINNLSSPADEASHFGFIHLLNGIYGHLRNDRAHRARLGSHNDEQDFLDAMAMISYAHRVLDRSSKADNDG